MSNLLALDQASRVSGWAFFQDGELKKFGKFSVDDDDIGERLYKIRENVKTLIETYDIDEVAFEDIQFQNNVVNNVLSRKTYQVTGQFLTGIGVMLDSSLGRLRIFAHLTHPLCVFLRKILKKLYHIQKIFSR